MARYTPGPWEAVLPDDPRGQPVGYYRGLICLVSSEPAISVVTDGSTADASEWCANALLIAAAPELLDALRELARVAGAVLSEFGAEMSFSMERLPLDRALRRAEAAMVKVEAR